MTTQASLILERLNDAEALETLYHRDPKAFRSALDEAMAAADDPIVLRVWQARLNYKAPALSQLNYRQIGLVICLGLVSGLLIRIPAIWLGEEWYYPRFAPLLLIMALACYYLIQQPDRRLIRFGGASLLVTAVYVSLLPDDSDSVIMALIHLSLVFFGYTGLCYLGRDWRETSRQLSYLRYLGELLVITSLLALGGLVLSGITIGLFSLLSETAGEWYVRNAGPIGFAGIIVVATYLYEEVFNRHFAIAGLLARIFSPLFLIMVVTYLLFALVTGQSPFVDREFLIIFNGLLVLVLAITVFSLLQRDDDAVIGLVDYINLALVCVTLVINAVALAAIVFRLASYGFTPNRITVLGINLVVFGHLAWLFAVYLQWVRNRVTFAAIERVIARYLPVYVVWAGVVTFIFPTLLGFR